MGGGTPPPVIVDSVITNTVHPCLIAYVAALGSERLVSEIMQLYQQTFAGNGKIFNVRFEQKPNLTSQGIPVPALSIRDPNNHNTWVITLNQSFISQNIGTYDHGQLLYFMS